MSGDTGSTLCVFDADGGASRVVTSLTVPPGGTCAGKPCWKTSGGGFSYTDKTLANDGVRQLRLRPGVEGKAQIALDAKGANLGFADASPAVLPVAQDPAVTVQLSNSDGACWSAVYPAPARVSRNDAFLDRGD